MLLVVGLGLLYGLTLPATVNGDGIGYLKQIPSTTLAPGHVGYLPLARALAAVLPHQTLRELVLPLRLLSLGTALFALVLLYATARRLLPPRPALFAVAFLGTSHAFGRAASEVEVYALALLPVVALLYCLVRLSQLRLVACANGGSGPTPSSTAALAAPGWAAAAGALWGLATLLHLSLVLLAPSLVLLLLLLSPPQLRWRCLLSGLLAMGLCGLLPILAAGLLQGQETLPQLLSWLRSADHGLPYPHSWRTPFAVLWGASKSLVYAPYPYEASWPHVVALSLAGAALLAALSWQAWQQRSRSPLPATLRPLSLLLGLPLVAFGVYFYPSDTERWLFCLPLAALLVSAAAGRAGAALLLAALLLNLAADRLPHQLATVEMEQAARAEALLRPDDLLIRPGHGWAELVGLGSLQPPRGLSLVSLVGQQRSLPRAVERLQREVRQALRSGRRVYVARLEDPADRRGFKELERQGLARAGFRQLFAGYRAQPTAVPQLWQLLLPVTPALGVRP